MNANGVEKLWRILFFVPNNHFFCRQINIKSICIINYRLGNVFNVFSKFFGCVIWAPVIFWAIKAGANGWNGWLECHDVGEMLHFN